MLGSREMVMIGPPPKGGGLLPMLKREFNTLEKIINDPGMKKFGEWIGKRDIIKIKHSGKGDFHK